MLLYMPGRRLAQQLLPLALGGAGIWVAQDCWGTGSGLRARADSSSARIPATGSKAGAAECAVAQLPAGTGTGQPDGALPALIAKLGLGGNEFANVRPKLQWHQSSFCKCVPATVAPMVNAHSSCFSLFAMAPTCGTFASLFHIVCQELNR